MGEDQGLEQFNWSRKFSMLLCSVRERSSPVQSAAGAKGFALLLNLPRRKSISGPSEFRKRAFRLAYLTHFIQKVTKLEGVNCL
jgi:hypothetical protein